MKISDTEDRDRNLSNDPRKARGQIVFVTIIFVALFAVMLTWTAWYSWDRREFLFNEQHNGRDTLQEERVTRGTIYANDGRTILAQTMEEGGHTYRYYPYGREYAHAVGYSVLGGAGVESACKYDLLHTGISVPEQMELDQRLERYPGNNVITTLDPALQDAVVEALDYYGYEKAAVIVTDPATGKILAMVSRPDYDPNNIEEDWDRFVNADEEEGEDTGILLNRVTQGRYPPGSTFKIVDAVELLQEDPNAINSYSFDCEGSWTYDGETVKCYHGETHGEVDLTEAFADSCNSAFSQIGVQQLDRSRFMSTLDKLMFNRKLPYDLPCETSYVGLDENTGTESMIQISIGQGTTVMTPLHMNMLTCAIANGGVLMEPYIIDSVTDSSNTAIKSYKPTAYGSLMSADVAANLTAMMQEVCRTGTAYRMKDTPYYVAGKTGSAEFGSSLESSQTYFDSHAWFTAFAWDGDGADSRRICLTIVLEEEGTGSVAVPVARRIFDAYFLN